MACCYSCILLLLLAHQAATTTLNNTKENRGFCELVSSYVPRYADFSQHQQAQHAASVLVTAARGQPGMLLHNTACQRSRPERALKLFQASTCQLAHKRIEATCFSPATDTSKLFASAT